MELVTLSMPVYNVEPYIEKALLSALHQTYEKIEYIIVDDGGTDNSMDIVRKIRGLHPRGNAIKIIKHPKNIGTGASRNTAIDNARGHYLFFMDSDDEITPDCIQKLYDEMQRSDVDFVQGSTTTFPVDVNNTSPIHISGEKNIHVERKKEKMINILNSIVVWNRLYKISFLRSNNIRCIPYHTVEDIYFTFQVSVKANAYSTIPDITYLYRGWDISQKTWTRKMFDQLPQIFTECLELLNKEPLNPKQRQKYKKKTFWIRVAMAEAALQTPGCIHPYINQCLSGIYLKDKDTFCNGILFLGYLISMMPLSVKIAFLKLHSISTTNNNKR
jgi:glycosyltransferase involved in cell wall biosynthesis